MRERRYGKFSHSIPLPQGVKVCEIRAAMENGVLTVTFPKTTPDMEPKKITIPRRGYPIAGFMYLLSKRSQHILPAFVLLTVWCPRFC
ncbi:hypothetical protein BKA93DRAFT_837795 [Sparassis latifolia]